MDLPFDRIVYIIVAGILLLAGVVILRSLFKLAWKIIRVALIILSAVLVVSYLLGHINFPF